MEHFGLEQISQDPAMMRGTVSSKEPVRTFQSGRVPSDPVKQMPLL